ncbi:ATP-binding protein [Bacillus suaedaesalsae]|uniref:histidine kinase n=1 Tax=Bacillus suaedaesalsae TaxID=2810349 RepID=A0ABS2DDE9_9BACI|nr:ATP-binding protein [Bacillus suaedaesalsae]MBM6616479.1 PAS domain S-box protein [Bacillus suaedaesalsae]
MKIRNDHKRKQLLQYIDESKYSILSNSTDVFLIIDAEGKIVNASEKCEVFLGYSRKLLLHDMNLFNLFDKALNENQSFLKDRVCEQLNYFDSKIKLGNGKIADVHVISVPIFFKHNDECIGSYLIFKENENTNSLQLKDEQYKRMINTLTRLSEKHAAAGQLAAGIAHEIRNPITAIKGFIQLLNSENMGSKAYFEIINSEIKRIEIILKELMVLAKPTKQSFEKVNLKQLLDQVVILMEPQALLNNIQIEKGYSFNNLWIMGDENQLKQVLINYIKNAIEAMPNGGNLKLDGAIINEHSVQIAIIDHGDGIPKDILKRIGEPFFTTKEHGTGLGMLVSHQIIEEHKGTITIKSSDNGTSIYVQMPLALFEIE